MAGRGIPRTFGTQLMQFVVYVKFILLTVRLSNALLGQTIGENN